MESPPETAPKLPPAQQEMVPRSGLEMPPAGEMMPPANFSEAIDRIGLGPFQTRLVIMCGMVSARLLLLQAIR